MISPTRAAAVLGAAAAIVISAPVANAAETYPPATPEPTVSDIQVSTDSDAPTVEDANVSDAGALPRTGTEVLGWTLGGTALLAAGGALVVVARRRGQHA